MDWRIFLPGAMFASNHNLLRSVSFTATLAAKEWSRGLARRGSRKGKRPAAVSNNIGLPSLDVHTVRVRTYSAKPTLQSVTQCVVSMRPGFPTQTCKVITTGIIFFVWEWEKGTKIPYDRLDTKKPPWDGAHN